MGLGCGFVWFGLFGCVFFFFLGGVDGCGCVPVVDVRW